jgi:hypothetical protein
VSIGARVESVRTVWKFSDDFIVKREIVVVVHRRRGESHPLKKNAVGLKMKNNGLAT